MATQWIIIDKSTMAVTGWQRSSKASSVPDDTSETLFREVTDAQLKDLSDKQAQMREAGRSDSVVVQNGELVIPEDTRPLFRVTPNATEVDIATPVTLTIEALNSDGSLRAGLNTTLNWRTLNGRVFKLTFVNGVATKDIVMNASGDWHIKSEAGYRVESEVVITGVE